MKTQEDETQEREEQLNIDELCEIGQTTKCEQACAFVEATSFQFSVFISWPEKDSSPLCSSPESSGLMTLIWPPITPPNIWVELEPDLLLDFLDAEFLLLERNLIN